MANRKVEPVEHADEHPATSLQNAPKDAQSTSSAAPDGTQPQLASSAQPATSSSCIRNSVLDEVVAHQDKRIAELERKVEKKKETIRRLSSPTPFISPPGLGVVTPHIPPSTAPQGSASPTSSTVQPQTNKSNPSPAATNTANSSQPQPHHSQPVAHNPAMAATVAAMAAASTPVSTALHPHFSFFPYPHPDNPVMASPFMSVVPAMPPHPAAQPLQPPAPATSSQPNHSSDDGANRQSRYWTPDEHQRFLAGMKTYGPRNYQQIAEVVGTRNAKQVRTHSQKYQKKLERDEARRRGDGRVPSDVHSTVRPVAPRVTATSDGNPIPTQTQLRQSDVVLVGSGSASGKNSQGNEAPQSAKSAEGSSSANIGVTDAAENSIDAVHANAAARAVAAEAVALSRGKLSPGAIMMLKKPQPTQPQLSNPSNPQAQSIRPRETGSVQQNESRIESNSTCPKIAKSTAAAQNQNPTTSHIKGHLSKLSSSGTPADNAQLNTSVPAGKGGEGNDATEPVDGKELRDAEVEKASSQKHTSHSLNGNLAETPESAEKRRNQSQGPSAVKIEPRLVSTVTKIFPPFESHDPAKMTTKANLIQPKVSKPATDPVTETVETNNNAEGIDNVAGGSVVATQPSAKVKIEDKGALPISRKDSVPLHPEKESFPNGQHPNSSSHEIESEREVETRKDHESAPSLKHCISGADAHSELVPSLRPNGSTRADTACAASDAKAINRPAQADVSPQEKRGEEGVEHVPYGAMKSKVSGARNPTSLSVRTENLTKDSQSVVAAKQECIVSCGTASVNERGIEEKHKKLDIEGKSGTKADVVEARSVLETSQSGRDGTCRDVGLKSKGDAMTNGHKEVVSSCASSGGSSVRRGISDGSAGSDQMQGTGDSDQAGRSEAKGCSFPIQRRRISTEKGMGTANGNAPENSEDTGVGEKRIEEPVSEERAGYGQAREKGIGDESARGNNGGAPCDERVEAERVEQERKRRLEDATGSVGKRAKVDGGKVK